MIVEEEDRTTILGIITGGALALVVIIITLLITISHKYRHRRDSRDQNTLDFSNSDRGTPDILEAGYHHTSPHKVCQVSVYIIFIYTLHHFMSNMIYDQGTCHAFQ